MSITKCSECGQEISTEATICPHCGNPNVPATVGASQSRREFTKLSLGLLAVLAISGGLYFVAQKYENLSRSYSGAGTFTGHLHQALIEGHYQEIIDLFSQTSTNAPTAKGNDIQLQEVKNLGISFYLGQIEQSGVDNLSDDLKNQITKIIYNAHIPTSILAKTPIIILNNLALTGDQYIPTPRGKLKVPDLKPDFLSEGGIYTVFGNGEAVIFINKPIIAKGQLTEVLTHELGHAVGNTLTEDQWKQFYQLRGIPSDTPRLGTNWNLSPAEDFAEVYKYVVTGIAVRTFYGQLVPIAGDIDIGPCTSVYTDAQSSYMPKSQIDPNDPTAFFKMLSNSPKIDYAAVSAEANADPKVQGCRKEAMTKPSEWIYGVPYKSVVGPKTKEFIVNLERSANEN